MESQLETAPFVSFQGLLPLFYYKTLDEFFLAAANVLHHIYM